jgi:hypothetical protein
MVLKLITLVCLIGAYWGASCIKGDKLKVIAIVLISLTILPFYLLQLSVNSAIAISCIVLYKALSWTVRKAYRSFK